MPASLGFDEYGEGIGNAWAVLRDNAARAGLSAAVPTCPGWTVRDLVAHQGMVHRWAAGAVRGERDDQGVARVEQEGLASPDPLAWLDEGATDLLSALAFAPADLDVEFFLPDAPDPRIGWARRQCHETTIHAVDAMSASLGRAPTPRETWIRPALARDGVDELLLGFLPRRRRDLGAEGSSIGVGATDVGAEWRVDLGAEGRVTARAGGGEGTPDVTVTGTAVELYLGLWNRGEEIHSSDPGVVERWRTAVQVHW